MRLFARRDVGMCSFEGCSVKIVLIFFDLFFLLIYLIYLCFDKLNSFDLLLFTHSLNLSLAVVVVAAAAAVGLVFFFQDVR